MTNEAEILRQIWRTAIMAALGILVVVLGIATGAPAMSVPGAKLGSYAEPGTPWYIREIQLFAGGINQKFPTESTHPINRAGFTMVANNGILLGYHVSDMRTGGLEVGLSNRGPVRAQLGAVFWADTPEGGQGTSVHGAIGYQAKDVALGVDYMSLLDSWGLWIGIAIH